MADKIIMGKNGSAHGIWVAKPGSSVQAGGPYLMSSFDDMMKIHVQDAVVSTGTYRPSGPADAPYRHDIEVSFTALDYIPLAFMGLRTTLTEPFKFPPDLDALISYGSPTLGNLIAPVGIAHNKLTFAGWSDLETAYFNYTVFRLKIRDKF
ncbi:hypothetical protein G3A39_41610 [Paraburkholderia aspalathi]|nr:hypothetical protein [Paraburkholderia aspalathi]